MYAELIDDRSTRSHATQDVDLPTERWQLAELTEYDLREMKADQLRRIITAGLQPELVRMFPRAAWNDLSILRRLAKQVRDTCRRQGY